MKVINGVPVVITAGGSGIIRIWRFDATQNKFEVIAKLEGHFREVTSLLLQGEFLLKPRHFCCCFLGYWV